ncbi:MAG: dihydrodipicolinate reductase [Butyrivibrio sp.]|nr:dihydrodipicolinate reductase [Butyrivibrio sp.]
MTANCVNTADWQSDHGRKWDSMTLMKERAVEMIKRMPEDNMTYVINILQNLEAMSVDRDKDKQRAKAALADILSMEKRLPEDFDPDKELMEARMEKYDNPG